MAGNQVLIGSRVPSRATDAAQEIKQEVPSISVDGTDNAEASKLGDIVFIAVPMAGHRQTVHELTNDLYGMLVIDVTARLQFQSGKAHAVQIEEGSLALQTKSLLPNSMVASALHHISAVDLMNPEKPLDCDVLVCGDADTTKSAAIDLISQIPGIRAVDGGDLTYSKYIEDFTAMLVNINQIHKGHSSVKLPGV